MTSIVGSWVFHQKTPGDSVETGDDLGVFVVHAALLPSGKVTWFSGHAEGVHYLTDVIEWNPLNLVNNNDPENSPPDRTTGIRKHTTPPQTDIFCCHFSHMPDGRILIVGGSTAYAYVGPRRVFNNDTNQYEIQNQWFHEGVNLSRGIRDILIFDPKLYNANNGRVPIEKVGELTEARWYPTVVTMPDGNVLVFSGLTDELADSGGSIIAETVELIEVNKIDHRRPYYTPKVLNFLGSNVAQINAAAYNRFLPTYPGLQLSNNGDIYSVGPTWRYQFFSRDGLSYNSNTNDDLTLFAQKSPSALEVDTKNAIGKWRIVESALPFREEGTCILLHPTSEGKILVLGGNSMYGNHDPNFNGTGEYPPLQGNIDDSRKARILDTTNDTFMDLPDMHRARINVSTVLLPDETVLIIGGHQDYKWNDAGYGHLICEIYNPNYVGNGNYAIDPNYATSPAYLSDQNAYKANPNNYYPFKEVAALTNPRTYHSASLLLPNGTVIAAGGVNPLIDEPLPAPPGFTRSAKSNIKTCEIYRPPYYFSQDPRPTINQVNNVNIDMIDFSLEYGEQFVISYSNIPQLSNAKVIFMGLGAMTHHTDTDQRSVNVDINMSLSDSNTLICNVPSDPKTIPPGHYMLWIRNGYLPCEKAAIIRIKQKRDNDGPTGSKVIPLTLPPVDEATVYSGCTITISRVDGYITRLQIAKTVNTILTNFDIPLTYFPKSKSWGARHLVYGRFPNVIGLAQYIIDHAII